LEIIAGFEKPSAGEIRVEGDAVAGPDPNRAMVFQQPNLFPWLTVMDNVLFGPRTRRRNTIPAARERARHLLDISGLSGFEGTYPYQLSGGMRQRVAIVRALMNNPRVLLMDEPFGALDAQTRLTMQELLLQIWNELKPTILFVTHDVDEAIFLGDRVGVMSARPGEMKLDISVPIARPRDIGVLIAPEFIELKARLLQELRQEYRARPEGAATAGPARAAARLDT
jgi:NitT/TauT family transport system ATP-binding protein